jgi:hypothetical protein
MQSHQLEDLLQRSGMTAGYKLLAELPNIYMVKLPDL